MSQQFTYSEEGLAMTKSFEGLRLTSYQDVVGNWTIGYGHMGRDVYPHQTITQAQADQLLELDLHTAGAAVLKMVLVSINQSQFDALVDFTFNDGQGSLLHSTLLRKLNAGDYEGAADQFLLWDHAGGKVNEGLLRRREAERKMFLS